MAKRKKIQAGTGRAKVKMSTVYSACDLEPMYDYASDLEESNMDFIGESASHARQEAYDESMRWGTGDEKEAEKAGEEAYVAAEEHLRKDMYDAVKSTYEEYIGEVFDWIKAGVDVREWDKTSIAYVDSDDWIASAEAVMEVINGVGVFQFDSLEDFLEVGPYRTAKEATVAHLHHLSSIYEVYGQGPSKRKFEDDINDAMRNL